MRTLKSYLGFITPQSAKADAAVLQDLLGVLIAGGCALNVLAEILPESAQNVEQASSDLTARFKSLAQNAMSQAETVQALVSSIGSISVGDKKISMDEFIQLFSKTLDQSISEILNVAKQSLNIVYSMNDAITNLKEIDEFSKQIQTITHHSNMLAINALIEARRAGDAGRGFGVVANEVKRLSSEIAVLSDNMGRRTKSIMKSIMDGYEVLKELATHDMNDQLLAKDTLEQLMKGLMKQSEDSLGVMASSADSSQEMSKTIRGMIMNLQFQDRNSQIIENSVGILTQCFTLFQDIEQKINALGTESPQSLNNPQVAKLVEEISSGIKLADIRSRYEQLLEDRGLSISPSQGDASKPDASNENIELF